MQNGGNYERKGTKSNKEQNMDKEVSFTSIASGSDVLCADRRGAGGWEEKDPGEGGEAGKGDERG